MIRIRYERDRRRWSAAVTSRAGSYVGLYDTWEQALAWGRAWARYFRALEMWWIGDPRPELIPPPDTEVAGSEARS